MKYIPREVVIPMGEPKALYSEMLCVIRVEDEAAGPFLYIHGEYDGDDENINKHCFALDSHEQIDSFAAVLHEILAAAEGATVKCPGQP